MLPQIPEYSLDTVFLTDFLQHHHSYCPVAECTDGKMCVNMLAADVGYEKATCKLNMLLSASHDELEPKRCHRQTFCTTFITPLNPPTHYRVTIKFSQNKLMSKLVMSKLVTSKTCFKIMKIMNL